MTFFYAQCRKFKTTTEHSIGMAREWFSRCGLLFVRVEKVKNAHCFRTTDDYTTDKWNTQILVKEIRLSRRLGRIKFIVFKCHKLVCVANTFISVHMHNGLPHTGCDFCLFDFLILFRILDTFGHKFICSTRTFDTQHSTRTNQIIRKPFTSSRINVGLKYNINPIRNFDEW